MTENEKSRDHAREDTPLVPKRSEGLGKRQPTLNPAGDLSLSGAALVLFCTAVGPGVVAVPRAFSFSGWGAGLAALTLSACLSAASLTCLFKCSKVEACHSTYHSLVQKHLPLWLSRFVDLSFSVLLLGTIGAMLLLAMHVWQSVELAVGMEPLSPTHMPWVLVVIALVLCLPRSFADLHGVSFINLCATITTTVLICIECAHIVKDASPSKDKVHITAPGFTTFTSYGGLLAALPLCLFGFFCQFQVPQLYSELTAENKKGTTRTAGLATVGCFLIYGTVGIFGYAAFGSETSSDVLKQLSLFDPSNHWVCLAQVLFGCVLLFSTPLVLAPLRNMVLRTFSEEAETFVEADDVSFSIHTFSSAALLVCAMMVALNVPGVDFIMGVLGATCVVFLVLIVPGMLTLQICGDEWRASGWLLIIAGVICTPLTFGAFIAQHLGLLPK